ncbi:hypothetical protein BGZ57DRAFT_714483, partial [Hyaloscypha finlandica]
AIIKYNLINSGGLLILTSSRVAYRPGKGALVGGILNRGIISLTKGLTSDLIERKIRVNIIVLGLFKNIKLLVGFIATLDNISEAYLYLIKADYTIGTTIEI